MTKPTIPEVIHLFAEYYKYNLAWGSLHIVLDDGNYSNKNVQYCLDYAIENGDKKGEELARILLSMSPTQRSHIDRKVGDYYVSKGLDAITGKEKKKPEITVNLDGKNFDIFARDYFHAYLIYQEVNFWRNHPEDFDVNNFYLLSSIRGFTASEENCFKELCLFAGLKNIWEC